MTADEIDAACREHLWDRRYEARQGVKDALTGVLHSTINRETGKVETYMATMAMEAVLGAVAPERRCLIVGTLIELWERWYAVREDEAVRREAWRPIGSLLADAAHAQIAGTVALFGGGSR
jgi:hypothetical protein